jgi:uncharacterized protein with ATP-grasp and redox domains
MMDGGGGSMKIQTECVPCLLKRIIFESELRNKNSRLTSRIIREACTLLGQLYDPSVCSAEIATKVHKQVYELLEDSDPYFELKQMSNKVAKSLLPDVYSLLDSSDDRLRTAMVCAIIGNILDFGIEGGSKDPEDLHDDFNTYFNEGLDHDDYSKVYRILKNSKRVVLFTDNCGEIVFDKVLCKELKSMFPDIVLSVIVRGEPIISDATIKDADEFGLNDIADQVLTTGCFAIGVDFNRLPKAVIKELNQVDLIICKGMANYEAFSETDYHPIVYLLRSKCTAIAQSMGVSLNKSIIKLYH